MKFVYFHCLKFAFFTVHDNLEMYSRKGLDSKTTIESLQNLSKHFDEEL